MKTILFFFFLLASIAAQKVNADPLLNSLQQEGDWNYQTILVNGKEIYQSTNASGGSQVIYDRYEAIKQVLSQYKRPFTVLDLGANNGFFSLKIAEDFDAVCVMVDQTDRLTEICKLNTDRNRIIHLKKRFSKSDILKMCQEEHFDVVLALLVLHHVDDWKTWVGALQRLGDNVIIETPSVDDPINRFEHTKALAIYLTGLPNGVKIGSFPRGNAYDHMLWFCQNPNGFTDEGGRLGIRPATFFQFSGAFPSRSYVRELELNVYKQCGSCAWTLQGIGYSLE